MQPERTKKELMDLARKRGIKGYSAMTKAQLEEAIAELEATAPARASGKAGRAGKADTTDGAKPVAEKVSAAVAQVASPVTRIETATPAESAVSPAGNATEEPATAVSAVTVLEPEAPADEPAVEETAAPPDALDEAGADLEDAISPADEGAAIVEDAPASSTPVIPLKKTWTNHELLIDETLPELPVQYGTDRIVLMVRDPFWSYAYWDLSPASVSRARAQGGRQLALKVHDVTGIVFGEKPSNLTYDLRMPFDGQRQWYLNMPSDGRTYVVQVGYLRADDTFVAIATSNVAANPISRPSSIVSDRFASLSYSAPLPGTSRPTAPAAGPAGHPAVEQWPNFPAILTDVEAPESGSWSEEDAERILATGLDSADPGPWSARFPKFGDLGRPPQTLSSHALSSWALAPGSAQHGAPAAGAKVPGKDFWLVANCELIVYGATEPDATLTVRGEVIPLREDGTFTLRFELPDGLHPIPIKAVNRDGDMERNIAFTVTRATTVGPSR